MSRAPGEDASGIGVWCLRGSKTLLVDGSMSLSIHNWHSSSWKGNPESSVFGETPGVRLLLPQIVPEAWGGRWSQGVYTTSSPPSPPLQTLHLLGFLDLLVHLFSSRAFLLFFSSLGLSIIALAYCLSYSYSAFSLSFLPLRPPLLHRFYLLHLSQVKKQHKVFSFLILSNLHTLSRIDLSFELLSKGHAASIAALSTTSLSFQRHIAKQPLRLTTTTTTFSVLD